MKRQVIAGTLMMVAGLGVKPVSANENVCIRAHEDARRAITDLQEIDEENLVQYGDEYIDAYLAEYEQATAEDDVAPGGDDQPVSMPKQAQDLQSYHPQSPNPDQAKFINRLASHAQRIGKEYDLYPSVIIAQAALESDWGRSTLSRLPYNNLFGVKGYFAGQAVNQATMEYDAKGRRFQVFSNFRRYRDEYESLKDYAITLDQPLYEGVHRRSAKDYRQATYALVGRYATDPYYNRKLNQLIDTYQLTKYDCLRKEDNEKAQPVPISEKKVGTEDGLTAKNSTVRPIHQKKKIPWYITTGGGIGTVGIVKILRKIKQ